MITKTWLIVLTTLVLLMALLLPACEARPKEVERVELSIGGAPAASMVHMRMEAFGDALRKANPTWNVTVLSGRATTLRRMLAEGRIDCTMMSTIQAKVYSEPEKWPGIIEEGIKSQALLVLSPWAVYFVMLDAKIPVNSLREVIDKKLPLRLAVGDYGQSSWVDSNLLFKAYGAELEDVEEWGGELLYESAVTAYPLLAAGKVDGVIGSMSGRIGIAPYLSSLAKKVKFKYLDIADKDALEKLKSWGLQEVTLPKHPEFAIEFITKETPTVNSPQLIICRPGLPEEVAYTICKTIWEARETLSTLQPVIEEVFEKPQGMMPPIGVHPLHPGAERFYREMGWLK